MTLNSTIGLISTVALILPVLCIIGLRLTTHRSFLALLVYYCSVFVYNLFTNGYIHADPTFVKYWGVTNNMLDAPLMLYFITYFKTSKQYARAINRIIAGYILFEIIVLAINGINRVSVAIILGPGLLFVCAVWISLFIKQAKWAIESKKATGKALISASLVFAYGCYLFIYLMFYIFRTHIENGVVNEQSLSDTYLVFYLCCTFSSLLLVMGIFIESKRVQKLNELKITRRELSSIYTNTKAAAPFRTAVLDFDKELMN